MGHRQSLCEARDAPREPTNAVYARLVSQPYPARTTVAVAALPLGARVEMDLVAT